MALTQDTGATSAVPSATRSTFSAHAVVTTMLCVLFAIMYLDRVNISAAAAPLKAHLSLTNTQVGLAFSAFSWAYFKEGLREHPAAHARDLEGLSVSLPDRKARIPFWILTKRMFPVTIVMFTYGWTYWVFVSWLPLCFANQHHVNVRNSALLTSIPLLAGLVGNTVGGMGSDLILKRTGRNRLARCSIVAGSLVGSALFLLPCLLIEDLSTIVGLLAASMFCLELTISPMYAVPMDISRKFAGLESAYIIMGVAITGIISPVVFGWLIDLTGNWNVPFATGIVIFLVGDAVVGVLRPDGPVVTPPDPL